MKEYRGISPLSPATLIPSHVIREYFCRCECLSFEYFKLYRSLCCIEKKGGESIIRDTTFPRNFAISVGQ